ncbi:MAG TPA: acetamidase/formamidase family protein [Mycobacteriales bacterium]|nr:acetamidase/formamidase family protein [Mycobacteriales bacterium]
MESHGFFDPGLPPAVTGDPGGTVRLRTLESGWCPEPFDVEDLGSRRRHPAWTEDAGHALTGPVEVRGARAGQVLEIRIDAVVPGSWGTTYANLRPSVFNDAYGLDGPAVHRWTLDPVAGTGRNQHGHTVALRPFLGVIGMPPAAPGRHSTIPPRRHGGNLDCKELVAGSTLWLPIPVDGALLSVGDGHAAQGDGEVSGTAIECPLDRVELTLSVRDDLPYAGPVARTPAGWVTMGFGDTLDEAAYEALNAMFDLLVRLHRVPRADAVALASVAVDLRVTQIVNQVVGAHAVLPPGAIR